VRGGMVLFRQTLTLRAVRLVETTSLAKGKLSVRSKLKVQMSWLRYQQPSTSSEPNSGASAATQSWRLSEKNCSTFSQIRNSLDLEAILSTAVETRELLGLIGVTSYGATDDPAPSFDLSHEARLPDLPRLLDNTRLKINNSYLKLFSALKQYE